MDLEEIGPSRLSLVQHWVLRGGAILLPLAYWPLTYDRYVLPKLLLARFLVLALALLLIARILTSRTVAIKRTPLDLPLLAFAASALLSTIFAVNANVALFGTYSRYDGVLTLLTYIALFWLAVQTLADSGDARALLRALLVGGYLVATVAIVQWGADSLAGYQSPRAFGTMGNANVLGAYLGLLFPLAYFELLAARSGAARLLAANVLVIIGLALLMSVSHSAWFGLAVAGAVLLAGRQFPALRSPVRIIAASVAGLAVLAVATPIALSRGTDIPQRLHIWQDSLSLIASRPLLGYGPDTFGLVYPGFQTGRWVLGYVQIDKAHSELLQIAATQGLLGVAPYIWITGAFVAAFWRGRRLEGAWALLAGWAAYQVTLMVNFTALSAAFPFWIFAAAAMVRLGAAGDMIPAPRRAGKPMTAVSVLVAAGLIAVTVPGLVTPYLADQSLRRAADADLAGRPQNEAEPLAADARALAPYESVYAAEVGNIAFEYGDWSRARAGYNDAAELGTFNPVVYRNLALADLHLGLGSEAVAAAQHAVFLDRFDPVNQAVYAQVLAGRP